MCPFRLCGAWLIATLVTAPAYAADVPKVGEPAPEIGLEQILQAPEGTVASWEKLAGKAVVLEFWTTWCGPCVAAIPHLNELADKYQDKPIQFIAITDEGREKIEKFLKKKPIHAWIGLDTDKSMHRAYGVRGIPHTVLVGKDGRIAGITHPSQLTEKVLDELLAGKPLSLPKVTPEKAAVVDVDAGPEPLFEIMIRPSAGGFPRSARDSRKYEASAHRLHDAIAFAYETPRTRIAAESELPDGLFDFRACVPSESGRLRACFQQALETAFGFRTQRDTREVEALVLTAPGGPGPGLTPTASTGGTYGSWGGGRLSGVNHSLATIARQLERHVEMPVLDETGLEGQFDWSILYDEGVEGDLLREVERELGLKATRTRRKVETLVLQPAKEEAD